MEKLVILIPCLFSYVDRLDGATPRLPIQRQGRARVGRVDEAGQVLAGPVSADGSLPCGARCPSDHTLHSRDWICRIPSSSCQ